MGKIKKGTFKVICVCGLKHDIGTIPSGKVVEFICSVPFYPTKGCGRKIKVSVS